MSAERSTLVGVMSDAEHRLRQRGLTIDGWDLRRDDEPDVNGLLVMRPQGDGSAIIVAVVRPGLTDHVHALFAEWVEQRIDRFFEHGPEPDGWQRRTVDIGWQLWARLVEMPSLD
jgi:hypothetical protein